ncbi:MAG: M20 metallopeptidase family protein [Thermomicrobiales bacterium]
MVMLTHIRHDIDEILPGVIADRRYLHEHPELGFEEYETAKFIGQRLAALGVDDIRTGINGTGITGLIQGCGCGGGSDTEQGTDRVILLRADIDALPILEENEVDYVSQHPGVMHACGHDAHTAILLGVARTLVEHRDLFVGTVKLLFQPAEEVGVGGAIGMIAEGVLENPHVNAVFGLHMNPAVPTGTVQVGAGPIFAAADEFDITVFGKGGHGAYPSNAIDPIAIGMQIAGALHTLVSRELDPMAQAVVNVCAFHAGQAHNVVPSTATLRGTVRSFDPDLRDQLQQRIAEIATTIAEASGATAEILYVQGCPAAINDPGFTDLVRDSAITALGRDNVQLMKQEMGAEDFAWFLQERPGSYIYVGSRNVERGIVSDCHHSRFDIDEDCLATGIEITVAVVMTYLAHVPENV